MPALQNNSERRLPGAGPCPRCGKLISFSSQVCIHCGLRLPNKLRGVPLLSDLTFGRIRFSDKIVLLCFGLYVLALALDISGGTLLSGDLFSMLSPSNYALFKLGMGGLYPVMIGRWWSLVTAIFLHGGLMHILFNMLWLRRIGPLVEELFGTSRFIIIFLVSGLCGAILTTALGTTFFVGASGSIFGLLGALIYYGRSRGGTFGSAIFTQMLVWGGIAFLFGLTGSGVDNWGHLGGLISGVITALVVGYEERGKQQLGHHVAALVCLGLVGVCFGLMFVYFFVG